MLAKIFFPLYSIMCIDQSAYDTNVPCERFIPQHKSNLRVERQHRSLLYSGLYISTYGCHGWGGGEGGLGCYESQQTFYTHLFQPTATTDWTCAEETVTKLIFIETAKRTNYTTHAHCTMHIHYSRTGFFDLFEGKQL